MRVLVVTSLYLSGHGNFVAEQVRSLRAIGLDVDVLFFDPRQTRANYLLGLGRAVRLMAPRKYDIIHTHHTYTMILTAIARRLARSSAPVVFTHHESESLDVDGRTRTWHPTSLLRHSLQVKRAAVRMADFVIYVSRQVADSLTVDGPHDIIPCGVDLNKFRPLDRGECRRILGLPEGRPLLFFPPNPRNFRKRYELARRTYERVRRDLPDADLIAGGTIEADTMPLYYNAADMVLQTSYCETSPTVVKEALACEVPVVSTDVGDTRDVLDGVAHCIVCADDPEELARGVLLARGHRAEGARRILRRKGLALDQVAQRVVRVYGQVLGC